MIKNLIHNGTFLGYGDRKITVNFYKRGYFLSLKEGMSATIDVAYTGGVFPFTSLFETNGTIIGESTYAIEFGDTYVKLNENTSHYERYWRVTFKLREDEDCKITLIFDQEGAPNDLTANPEILTFSGRQEFLPLELTSSEGDPLIYRIDGGVRSYMLSEKDQPIKSKVESDIEGDKYTWFIGLECNAGNNERTGEVLADLERTMGGLTIPIVQERIEYETAITAEIDIHDEGHGAQVEMSAYSNEGYIEFRFLNLQVIPFTNVELIDCGYGTDWVHLDSEGPTTSRYFRVDDVPFGETYGSRCVILRVYNAVRPTDYAECMLIQNNY